MERLTEKRQGQNVIPLRQDGKTAWALSSAGMGDKSTMFLYGAYTDRLAAYEDTGLTPEEIAIVKNIVGRIATADYPHNFQRERSDIAAYMYWITSVMKDVKEWWNDLVTQNKGGDE